MTPAAMAGLCLVAAGILLIVAGCLGPDLRRLTGHRNRHLLREVDLVVVTFGLGVLVVPAVTMVVVLGG